MTPLFQTGCRTCQLGCLDGQRGFNCWAPYRSGTSTEALFAFLPIPQFASRSFAFIRGSRCGVDRFWKAQRAGFQTRGSRKRRTGMFDLRWSAGKVPENGRETGDFASLAMRAESGVAENRRKSGGGSWIRTSEGVSQQIYSLPPLATWVSYQ